MHHVWKQHTYIHPLDHGQHVMLRAITIYIIYWANALHNHLWYMIYIHWGSATSLKSRRPSMKSFRKSCGLWHLKSLNHLLLTHISNFYHMLHLKSLLKTLKLFSLLRTPQHTCIITSAGTHTNPPEFIALSIRLNYWRYPP